MKCAVGDLICLFFGLSFLFETAANESFRVDLFSGLVTKALLSFFNFSVLATLPKHQLGLKAQQLIINSHR